MSVSRSIVLDAHALLAYLQQENGYELVVKTLASGRRQDVQVLMNDVNVGEVYYTLHKYRSQSAAEKLIAELLPVLPITLISNSTDDVLEAARLKAQYPISYADAFAAATAISYCASLMTGDREFKQLEHMVKINWLPAK